ncbi:Rieske 2Fe-2S domain-containing protein [Archangium lansingense]|uniref:Rieske 2Fe-2S domain-containing protein n=1 Tax=Archangium lansingense TaxID=2995310 RepID=A0ABT4A0Y4_9BACT|nr:Rieske 2Fe-2S domain-containing protein [Archangium lansinium]MCY1074944.1 Rieske 2Fe-2S domain-containing protein [Archangium lansinium]
MAVNVVAWADPVRRSKPVRLRSWYLACPSEALRPGQVMGWSLGGRELVLFRGQSGRVQALSAHCAHMGAHLAHGTVIGEHLRCPLHHWQFDGSGICRAAPGRSDATDRPGQRAYPVVERYGAILVFNGPVSLFPPPEVGSPELRWRTAPPVTVGCSWLPIAANSFDIEHLRTVHHRELRDSPVVECPDPFTLRLRYTSRVIGTGLSDRMMKALSRDRIGVTITLHGGTLMSVESDLGRTRSALLAGFRPCAEGVSVQMSFAARPARVPGMDHLRLAVSRWLFTSFLRRDLSVLNRMRFNPSAAAADPVLRQLLDFAAQLPEDPDDERG